MGPTWVSAQKRLAASKGAHAGGGARPPPQTQTFHDVARGQVPIQLAAELLQGAAIKVSGCAGW